MADNSLAMHTLADSAPPEQDWTPVLNRVPRGNLASGDRALIEAAFGMPDGTLDASDLAAVVESAMGEGDTSQGRYYRGNLAPADRAEVETAFDMPEGTRDRSDLATIVQSASISSPSEISGAQVAAPFDMPGSTADGSDVTAPAESAEGEGDMSQYTSSAEQTNMELQEALQEQQRNLRRMSEISEMLHEYDTDTIREMG